MKPNDWRRWTPPAYVTLPVGRFVLQRDRRERRIRYGIAFAAVVLPTVIARIVLGAFMGSP